jgi:Tol biopolymer transport system component
MFRARVLGLVTLLAILLGVASSRASTPSPIVFAADRAPSVTGEVYRLDPSGRRVDLSKSPYQDTNPAVSWDGKRVAFLSDRSGRTSLYEVGIDGRGIVRLGLSVAPLPDAGCQPQLVWQQRGDVLAVAACDNLKGLLWIVRPGRKSLKLLQSKNGLEDLSWSPDGRVLVASPFRGVARAFSPEGRPLWKADGSCCGSWSRQGLFALPLGSRVGFQVNDESGRVRFKASGSSSSNLAWSSDGRLAVIRRDRLEVWTSSGGLVFGKSVPGQHGLVWADERHVIVGGYGPCLCHARSIDIGTGKVSPASGLWFDPLSADRKLAIVTPASKPGFALGVAPAGGGRTRTYARIGGCLSTGVWSPAASSLQFAGRSRSVVYQSWSDCDPPFSNLYSVAPGGGAVKRLTDVRAQETQPALSPDGSEIAYVWASATGLSCGGCSDGIRIASADGKELRTLTNPQSCTFDDSPTWSPDASTILFSEVGCDSSPGTPGDWELYTVPAGGGPVHDLGIAGREPAWGPSRIAYVGADKSNSGLWTANPDGSDRVKVAETGRWPVWSADGRLAYRPGGYGTTTVVVGAQVEKLPFTSVTSLAWTPDGTRFVVTASSTKTAPLDVYTVRTDGTDPVRLTKNYDALGARSDACEIAAAVGVELEVCRRQAGRHGAAVDEDAAREHGEVRVAEECVLEVGPRACGVDRAGDVVEREAAGRVPRAEEGDVHLGVVTAKRSVGLVVAGVATVVHALDRGARGMRDLRRAVVAAGDGNGARRGAVRLHRGHHHLLAVDHDHVAGIDRRRRAGRVEEGVPSSKSRR